MPSWKKVIISGSNAALNSLTVSNGITGSLFGTASYATVAANGGVTQLLAGPNITLSPTNGLGQVTISSLSGSGGGGFNTATGSYGSFYDTTTQTNPVGNIPRSMSLDTTDITNGVSVSGSTNPFNTYIKTQNAGVYNIQFSAQIDKTDGGTDDIVIWLRKNGIDLTDTATTITLPTNNSKAVAAWNWFVNSAANDYYQIIWLSADTDMKLLAEPISGTHPGIPSVIVTANRVDQFLSNTGSFSGSFTGQFTGSLFGTASFATSASFASTASFLNSTTNAFIQNGNSFGATALLGTNDNQSLALETNGTTRMFISSSGFVGINTTSPLYSLDVVGNIRAYTTLIRRDTSAGSAFINYNESTSGYWSVGMPVSSYSYIITDSNYGIDKLAITNGSTWGIGIGKTTPNARLDVSGSAIISGSFTVTPGTVREFQVNTTGVDIGNLITDAHTVTGSLSVSGSVNILSSTLQYSNITAVTSGSTSNVASFNTSSFTAAFFDYVTTSGTNARAGTVFTVWNGNSVEYAETSTNDIGNTFNLVLSASVSAGAIRLQATSLSGSWSVKTLARMI